MCRELLEVNPNDIPERKEYTDFAEFLLKVCGFDVKSCPKCSGRLLVMSEFFTCLHVEANSIAVLTKHLPGNMHALWKDFK